MLPRRAVPHRERWPAACPSATAAEGCFFASICLLPLLSHSLPSAAASHFFSTSNRASHTRQLGHIRHAAADPTFSRTMGALELIIDVADVVERLLIIPLLRPQSPLSPSLILPCGSSSFQTPQAVIGTGRGNGSGNHALPRHGCTQQADAVSRRQPNQFVRWTQKAASHHPIQWW